MRPTTGCWKCLAPVWWSRTSCAAQPTRNSGLRVGELAHQVGQLAIVGVAAGFGAQQRDGGAGHSVPVGVEIAGGRVQEAEAGHVGRAGRVVEDRRVQRPAERVDGEEVQAPIADEGRGTGHRLQDAQHAGPYGRRRAAARRSGGPGRAGQVEQVESLGLVELKGARDGIKDVVGDAADVPLLQTHVPVGAHPGQHGDLFAPQAGHAAAAAAWQQPGLLRRELGPPRSEELADLRSVVHSSTVRRAVAGRGVAVVPR